MRGSFVRTVAMLVAVALSFGTILPAEASNPKAISVRIKCELMGVNGTPDTPTCRGLDGWFDGRLDWVSGGVVLFQESGPFFGALRATDELLIFADGNGNEATFNSIYQDPATSILTAPDLTLRLYASDRRGALNLVAEQRYMPVASALWAKHSEDTVGLQAAIDSLRESALTITAGAGLLGGGTVGLGGSLTLAIDPLAITPAPGSITNAQLANSTISVLAGQGLAGGGIVSLGGSTLLRVGLITGAQIADGTIDNGDIAGGTRFVSIESGAGSPQFAITNAAPTLAFDNTPSVNAAFDPVGRRVSFSVAPSSIGSAQVNPAQIQARVTGTCAAGMAIGSINENGTVTCVAASGTPGATVLSVVTTLVFSPTPPASSHDVAVVVPGAVMGDAVALGVSPSATPPGLAYTGWVSAPGLVTIRLNNYSLATQPSVSGIFRATVIR